MSKRAMDRRTDRPGDPPAAPVMTTIQLPAGGFSREASCVYVLSIDGKIYIGKTGTTNKTGTSSPYQRLALHLRKNGATQSAPWELFDGDLNEVDVAFCFSVIPQHLSSHRIERALLFEAQKRFGAELLLNRSRVQNPPGLDSEEELYLRTFLAKIAEGQGQ